MMESFHESLSPHSNRTKLPSRAARLRSLTRLVVGGVEYGLDELLRQLQTWENQVDQSQEPGAIIINEQSPVEEIPGEDQSGAQTVEVQVAKESDRIDRLRLAAVGLLFEAQDSLSTSMDTVKKVEQISLRLARPLLSPLRQINNSRILHPVHHQFDKLVKRGQSEVDRWVARGQEEELYSRKLAEVALDRTVDEYIEYLTNNPEVKELVQTQSTGLANEVIEEVRERTVSADTFLEGVARSLLRRVPRAMLPQPPEEVRQGAIGLRLIKTKEKT